MITAKNAAGELLENTSSSGKQVRKGVSLSSAVATEYDTLMETANYHDNQQYVMKIKLNSFYGALANKYFRFFDQRVAEAITVSGQYTIRWAEKILNEYLNNILKTNEDYVIAIDTDSVYLNMGPLVEKILPNETNKTKIVDFLNKA